MPAATGAPATLVKYGMSKVGVAVLQGSVSGRTCTSTVLDLVDRRCLRRTRTLCLY